MDFFEGLKMSWVSSFLNSLLLGFLIFTFYFLLNYLIYLKLKILTVTFFRGSEAEIFTIKIAKRTPGGSVKSYRKPPRTYKFTRIFPASNEGGHWKKSTKDREGSWYRNYDAASGPILNLVRVFI
jgi:hypothetical protein